MPKHIIIFKIPLSKGMFAMWSESLILTVWDCQAGCLQCSTPVADWAEPGSLTQWTCMLRYPCWELIYDQGLDIIYTETLTYFVNRKKSCTHNWNYILLKRARNASGKKVISYSLHYYGQLKGSQTIVLTSFLFDRRCNSVLVASTFWTVIQ